MGYSTGIQWNDDLIKNEILLVKEILCINSMPSYGQIRKVRKSNDLNLKISKTGGIEKWAKELGLEIKRNETRIGKRGEEIAEKILISKGYNVINVSEKNFPYDLLVNNDIKIDVKISHMYIGESGNFYSCNTEKPIPTCDIYFVICERKVGEIDKILLIPSKEIHITQISIGEFKSKYDKYIDRWDYIERYDNFYKSL